MRRAKMDIYSTRNTKSNKNINKQGLQDYPKNNLQKQHQQRECNQINSKKFGNHAIQQECLKWTLTVMTCQSLIQQHNVSQH